MEVIKLVYRFEDFKEGQNYTKEIKITSQMIEKFAELSGDNNPVHLDDDFAKNTIFGKRIAHGMLGVSLFSTVLGTQFPGEGTIILNIEFKFIAPIYVDETVYLSFTIIKLFPVKKRLLIDTVCKNQEGKKQIIGSVKVWYNR